MLHFSPLVDASLRRSIMYCLIVASLCAQQGEIFISDVRIGCGNYERNCPYHVIYMAAQKPPKKGGGLSWLLFGKGAELGKRQPDYDPTAPEKIGEMRLV